MLEDILSFLYLGLTSQYVAHAATARTSSSVRPRILFRHVRSRSTLIPADSQTDDKSGLFSKTTRTIELAKVQDVRVDQTLGQRLLKIGDLSLESAGGTSRIVMQSIDRPQEAADHILELSRARHSGV